MLLPGQETLRREGRDRAVLPGSSQHDDEDQGAPETTGPDPGQAGDLQPVCGPEGTSQADDHRDEALQDGKQGEVRAARAEDQLVFRLDGKC